MSGQRIVYFDKYKLNEIGAVRPPSLKEWVAISSSLYFPPAAQHGSVMRIPFEMVKHLL